jgi:hypothetical protein
VVHAAVSCAQACTVCAESCRAGIAYGEPAECVAINLCCAEICTLTAHVLNRRTVADERLEAAVLAACVVVCDACGRRCEEHADAHEPCRVCAEACRWCELVCRELLDAMS